ncbi:MAG: alanine racemase [Capsulimonadales bacterium]|nr:alanine racemase [Capsulimonadales bacterium]
MIDPITLPYSSETARTWADVSPDALRNNARLLQPHIGPTGELMAVVKANAYGHGSEPVARFCSEAGIRRLAVATVAEATELRRQFPAVEIHLLAPFLLEEAEDLVRNDIVPFVSSLAQTNALIAEARSQQRQGRVFVCLDTGMGREGGDSEEASAIFGRTLDQPEVRPIGIATHFASADEAEGTTVTRAQIDAFFAFLRRPEVRSRSLARPDGGKLRLSLSNSPATLLHPLPPLPEGVGGYLFRAGLALYGIEPCRGAFTRLPGLRPVLEWKARVTLVRDLPTGATVGYGRTFTILRPSQVATVAAGYADGLPRRLSNTGVVLIDGQRFPIIGRVSMDQCQVDVTDSRRPIRPGDVATLIGSDGDEIVSVLDVAETVDATPHELTTGLSARVVRRYPSSA